MKKNKEVVKHSACISISGSVSLMARRTFNVFLSHAYDDLPETGLFTVNATDVFKALKVNSHNWDALKDALKELRTQEVEYDQLDKNGEGGWFNSALLADAGIMDGAVTFEFSTRMRGLLYDPAVYARINLLVQNRFKSKHSLALYELCMDYKKVRSTGAIPLQKLRTIFGVEKSYPQFNALNQFVFQPALKEINAPKNNTGLNVKMQKIKTGRKVTGVKFLIKTVAKKKKEKLEDPDLIDVKTKPDYERMSNEQRQAEGQELTDKLEMVWANFQALGDADQEAKWQDFEREELSNNLFMKDLGRDHSGVKLSFKNWLAKA